MMYIVLYSQYTYVYPTYNTKHFTDVGLKMHCTKQNLEILRPKIQEEAWDV